ncbi:MAG: OmpA family protein, partial [Acidovorax sp.]|nr:OmpA family protein [Acidovorax sp.]
QASEITLSGRTDSTGPAATNDGLAKARAQAVLRQLLALSPAIAAHVSVDAQGTCCYAESNDSPAGRANNRRVEIRYRIDGDDPP